MYRQSEKKLVKQQYILHMSPQYGEVRPQWLRSVREFGGTLANVNRFRVLPSLLQKRRSAEANQALHDVWPSSGLLHCIYIFRAFAPWRSFARCKILYVQVMRSPILAVLLHGTPAESVNQTLQRDTRNGITELSQRAPPIFGWAAITLGISPHSS